MTDDTKRGKSKLQRLDPKAWIGYLSGYRSMNIFRIWVPTMAKVITTRDVVFDEELIFTGDEKDIMDNLMHSTLEEIKAWIRTVELPPGINNEQEETQSFLEDESFNEGQVQESTPDQYDDSGRKVRAAYPSPPLTPPPVALLMNLMTAQESRQVDDPLEFKSQNVALAQLSNRGIDHPSFASRSKRPDPRSADTGSQSVGESLWHDQMDPWAAAFMAGARAGEV